MKLTEVINYLDRILLAKKFKDKESNGLVVKGKYEVNKIAVATNTSFESINKTVESSADILLVHHGPWKWTDQDNRKKKLSVLKKNGISLYVAHDSMDCVPEIGIGNVLAKLFDIKIAGRFANWNITPWYKKEGKKKVDNVYVGVYGSPKKKIGFDKFVKLVKNKLKCEVESWKTINKVKKVGIIPGGGLEPMWIKEAKDLGCDTFVSGQNKMFGVLYGLESGMNIITATHYATESVGMKNLSKIIKKDLNLECLFIKEKNTG